AAQGFDPCGSGESQRAALERLGLPLLRRRLSRADLTESGRTANQAAFRALLDPDGLGKVAWLLHTRGLEDCSAVLSARPPRWEPAPLLGPQHLRLPRPESLDALGDFEAQWRSFWGGADAEEDT